MWLLLFDIDGTLLRLRREPVQAALQEALSLTLGRSVPVEWLHDLAGKTDLQIFAEAALRCGWSELRIRRAMPQFTRHYVQAFQRRVQPGDLVQLPGVDEVLRTVRGLPGIVVGLLTGNLEPLAWWKLRHAGLAGYFQLGAFGSDHWERKRLLPVAWERARLMGMSVAPRQTVLVGDSPRDVLCARAWNVPCIAVATGSADAAVLQAVGAAAVLPNLACVDAFCQALYELCTQAHHRY
jgi:phosphoglycolate phosphatase-like HAD superfamily hydrolase